MLLETGIYAVIFSMILRMVDYDNDQNKNHKNNWMTLACCLSMIFTTFGKLI